MMAGTGELADCGRCSCVGEDTKSSLIPNGDGPGKALPKLNGWRCVSVSTDFIETAVVEWPLVTDNDGLDKDGFLLLVNCQHTSPPIKMFMVLTQATPLGRRVVPGPLKDLTNLLSLRKNHHSLQMVP